MNRIRRLVALVLLPLWGVVLVHCGMELDGLFGAPTHNAKASGASEAGDNDPDGGHSIESGQFDGFVDWLAVAQPTQFAELVWPAVIVFDSTQAVAASPQPTHPPPELAGGWSFERRAALSPRAPTLAS